MATATEIISRGYRRSNLITINRSPTTAEAAEGLAHLNSFILSCLEVELADINVGGEFDQSGFEWAPANSRLVVSQSAARTIKLSPYPYDGQRVAWVDASGNFATHNLTIDPNGRKIGGASTLVLSTNGDNRLYMYRADTGNWVRLTSLVAADEMPFPTEFDDYFVTGLAILLNPSFSAEAPPSVIASYQRGERQIRARYRRPRPQQDMGSLGLMGQSGFNGGGEASFYRGGA